MGSDPQDGDPAPTPRPRWLHEVLVMVILALLVTAVIRTFVLQVFVIPSGSMEPTFRAGDRVAVSKLSYRWGEIKRGDVIIFDGQNSFVAGESSSSSKGMAGIVRAVGSAVGVSPSQRDFTKRVVGLPGDRVSCCDVAGRITVNGQPLEEPYIFPGDVPSTDQFDVTVPPGRLWVMGDHRSNSADSRAHLGDPGGGTVPVDRVVGKVVFRVWPPSRIGGLDDDVKSTRE
ncbi:MAG: signal peptidase I [Actinomycetota bacterium]